MSNFGIDYVKNIGPSYLATMKPTSNAGPFSFEDPLDDFIFRRAIVAFKVQARNTPLTEINV
jgi:hypothetical protein